MSQPIQIFLSRNASPSEKYAARELESFLPQIWELPVVVTNEIPQQPNFQIFLGISESVQNLCPEVEFNQFGVEDFFIKTVKNTLLIAGHPQRGTLYGVYHFLEEILGCRWYTDEVSFIPKKSIHALPQIDLQHTPAFEYREIFYVEAQKPVWAARNRLNGNFIELPEEMGGKVKYQGFVHTFNDFVPVEKYFESHPEYFAYFNGARQSWETQLCLTNPDVLKLVVAGVLRWKRENPDANIISVSQNDFADGHCTCENCRTIDETEESAAGSLIWFLNQVAEQVCQFYPDLLIDTLAYHYTLPCPKSIVPHPNIIIRICHMKPSCDAHALEDCPRNADYVETTRSWRKIANHLFAWHYVTDFWHYWMPFPNFNAIKKDTKFYLENGVTGIFYQGNGEKNGGGENCWLRSWVLAKLLWQPDLDVDVLVQEFLQQVYGPAWEPLWKYHQLIHTKIADENLHFHLYALPEDLNFDRDFIEKCQQLFEDAEQLADTPEQLERVVRARLPMDYLEIFLLLGQEEKPVEAARLKFLKSKLLRQIDEFPLENHREFHSAKEFKQFLQFDGRFIKHWNLIGVWPDDPRHSGLQVKRELESDPDLVKLWKDKTGKTVGWQQVNCGEKYYLDLNKYLPKDGCQMAYLLTYIFCEHPCEFPMNFSTSDGSVILLNDVEIYHRYIARDLVTDGRIVQLPLKHGWNKLMIKVNQINCDNWTFSAQIADPGNQLRFTLRPEEV